MQSPLMRINARSKAEAMDWSLVLASQGIESMIQPPDAEVGWGLLVAAEDYERALESVRLYQRENRFWPLQRTLFEPGILFDWGSLGWVALLVLFYWLDVHLGLRERGMMVGSAVAHGQWWRIFTALWLHADVAHLAANATVGLVLLGLVMAAFGPGAGLLAAQLAGAGGNLAVWLLAPGRNPGLGASGMVMGALGLLAVHSIGIWRKDPHKWRFVMTSFLGGVMLLVLLGLDPASDVLAHLAGFISGLVFGGLLAQGAISARNTAVNLIAGTMFVLLVVVPWIELLTRSIVTNL